MVQRTANWRSRTSVKGRLQAALYWMRKREWKDQGTGPGPGPGPIIPPGSHPEWVQETDPTKRYKDKK